MCGLLDEPNESDLKADEQAENLLFEKWQDESYDEYLRYEQEQQQAEENQ
jgi:hypothetical protein